MHEQHDGADDDGCKADLGEQESLEQPGEKGVQIVGSR